MAKLVESLGIGTFLQPGDSSSIRIVGGAAEIVKRIVDELCAKSSDDDRDVQERRRPHLMMMILMKKMHIALKQNFRWLRVGGSLNRWSL